MNNVYSINMLVIKNKKLFSLYLVYYHIKIDI